MPHVTTASVPAAPAVSTAAAVASAPPAASAAPVRCGPQPNLCTPRHLAIVPEHCPQTRAAALAWLDTLSHVIDGCTNDRVEQLSIFASGQDLANAETFLREVRAWLCGHAAALARNGVALRVIGNPDAATREALRFAERVARENMANVHLHVNLAIGYDGRSEIAAAARALAAHAGPLRAEALQQHLASAELPAVDLLIRTGGETRLSHFLLWQTAYAELLFAKTPWEEFGRELLQQALADFAQRRRTFGGLNKM